MRYHYFKPQLYAQTYGETYVCDHPVYSNCTLFRSDTLGLAVIQQRYDPKTKHTWWSEIDPWLPNALYLHPDFNRYFKERAGICVNGCYPTVAVRQIMWALKMKPLPRQPWETVFDRKNI